jgi:hypothetical protein
MTTETISPSNRQAAQDACTSSSLDKTLRLLAGVVVTGSVLLGMTVHENWFYLTLFAGLNLFQSGLTNWCPAMTVLRKLGLR